MRKAGCAIGIIGGILCIIGLFFLGKTILRATQARAVQTIAMGPGNPIKLDRVKVDTSRLCMISVRARVRSEHARQAPQDSSENMILEYAFPFRYKITDQDGNVLATETTEFSDNDGKMHTKTQEHVTEQGGSAVITSDYVKFPVLSGSEITVEAQLDADDTYHAIAEEPQLIVYDNVSKHTKSVTIGIVALAVGAPVSFLGILLFMIGSIRKAETQKLEHGYTEIWS